MKKPVIVISSHVARGSVGNRAAVFALEVLGHPVWAVPTVILPFHPGHGKATRIIPDAEQFSALLDDLANSRWVSEVGGILTGYLATESQAIAVAGFIAKMRSANPNLIHVCDPVMGDGIGENARLYIAEETASAIRDHLVPLADTITPNRFEISWLTGLPVETPAEAITAAKRLRPESILVTSMPGYMRGNIGNLLISKNPPVFAEHRQVDNPPNGPGDLTAALFLSHLLDTQNPVKALQKTTASVFEIVAGAAKRGADELMLETDAGSITRPMAMVQIRNVTEPQSAIRGKRTVFKPTSL
jgi:pyridoxine kinase